MRLSKHWQATLTSNDPAKALLAESLAREIKTAADVTLPRLKHWNYGPCKQHDTPRPDCEYRACGGDLFAHQRVGAAWLYVRKKALLADLPGCGKSAVLMALLCMLKERDELPKNTVLVSNTPAVGQWLAEFGRFAPGLTVESVSSTLRKPERIERYARSWDVLVVGQHLMTRDIDALRMLKPGMLITDDVDPILNHKTRTHKAVLDLSQHTERAVIVNASSIQLGNLSQLHASMMPIGGRGIWGSLPVFEKRYLKKEWTKIHVHGRVVNVSKNVGIKNGKELQTRLDPWVIRRKYEDLTDVNMPTLMPATDVWLDLHKAQRDKYTELQKGVLEIQRKEGTEVRHATALTMISYGQQIAAGLPALGEPDGPQASVKLDWVMHRLTGAWEDRKIVVFIKNRGLVAAFAKRCAEAGIGAALVWGEQKADVRAGQIKKFWEDPDCRVLIGTSALERSLNLQVANIVVYVDCVLNPERMKQILGRIRRAGSAHEHIWQFRLFAAQTQEAGYLDVLSKREAINSYVWGESQELFSALSPGELLELINP